MPDREERLASNEVLFREVNEHIAELATGDGFYIVCECANTECEEKVLVPMNEYERIRQHERRFMVVPGHTVPDVEDLVERHELYDVVEKHPDVMP